MRHHYKHRNSRSRSRSKSRSRDRAKYYNKERSSRNYHSPKKDIVKKKKDSSTRRYKESRSRSKSRDRKYERYNNNNNNNNNGNNTNNNSDNNDINTYEWSKSKSNWYKKRYKSNDKPNNKDYNMKKKDKNDIIIENRDNYNDYDNNFDEEREFFPFADNYNSSNEARIETTQELNDINQIQINKTHEMRIENSNDFIPIQKISSLKINHMNTKIEPIGSKNDIMPIDTIEKTYSHNAQIEDKNIKTCSNIRDLASNLSMNESQDLNIKHTEMITNAKGYTKTSTDKNEKDQQQVPNISQKNETIFIKPGVDIQKYTKNLGINDNLDAFPQISEKDNHKINENLISENENPTKNTMDNAAQTTRKIITLNHRKRQDLDLIQYDFNWNTQNKIINKLNLEFHPNQQIPQNNKVITIHSKILPPNQQNSEEKYQTHINDETHGEYHTYNRKINDNTSEIFQQETTHSLYHPNKSYGVEAKQSKKELRDVLQALSDKEKKDQESLRQDISIRARIIRRHEV